MKKLWMMSLVAVLLTLTACNSNTPVPEAISEVDESESERDETVAEESGSDTEGTETKELNQAQAGYTVNHPDKETSTQTTTDAEAIKEKDSLTQEYPVGTEFTKESVEVAQAEPAIEPAKEQPAEAESNAEQQPTPAQTQQTVPPPAPTPEEIAAAQAAQAQAAAEAAAAQAAAEAQAQAEAIAAEAQAQAEAAAAAQAAAQAQADAEAAAAQAAGSMSDPQRVRDQIAATAEAYDFSCGNPYDTGGSKSKSKFVLEANNFMSKTWTLISVIQRKDGSWVVSAFTDILGRSDDSNVSSIEEIKEFIASHAY